MVSAWLEAVVKSKVVKHAARWNLGFIGIGVGLGLKGAPRCLRDDSGERNEFDY